MRHLIRILLLCLWASAVGAQTNVIYFKVGDISAGAGSPNLKGLKVVVTDTTESPRIINGVLISPSPKTSYSQNDFKAYFTNIVWGTYSVTLYASPQVSFDIQVETNTTGIVDGGSLTSITNVPNPASDFYTKSQVDTLFSDFQGGVTIDQLLFTSNVLQGQITSGGATTLVVTSIVNSATGVIVKNGADLNFNFSSQGTNNVQSIAQPLVNSASNILATASATLGSNLTNDVNSTSNSLALNSQAVANITSNLLQGNINTLGANLTNDVNTTSNSVVLTAQTISNTTSNFLQTGINTLGANLTNDVNTTSNLLVVTSQTIANTTSNFLQTGINNLGANLTNDVNTTSNALQSQITAGGITAITATNIINGLTGDVGTNGANLTLIFTTTGTNDIKSITQPSINSASNSIQSSLLSVLGSPVSVFAAFDSAGNLVGTNNGVALTNLVAHTHEGTATNLNITFNGVPQLFTITNGPDVWLNWSGANGAVTFLVTTNIKVHSSTTFNKFLAGSNGVSSGVYQITNGLLSVGSFGGTNSFQLVPAIGEFQ